MTGLAIRPLTLGDAPLLPAVERDAASRFRTVGLDDLAEGDVSGLDFIASVIRSGVALGAFDGGRLAGFILAGVLDDGLHVYELSVAVDAGGRGIGSALLAAAAEAARRRGLARLSLSTFADVAWNAPFYRKRGFAILAERDWPPSAHLIRNAERAAGLPLDRRVFMTREIDR